MSDELRRQIDIEREYLRRLMDHHRTLLDKCAIKAPSDVELSALAGVLQSFYNGIENVFKRIALEVDRSLPKGESWHKDLLLQMARTSPSRGPVISAELMGRLSTFMGFRHFYRHSYVFHLEWSQMQDVVTTCEETLEQFFEQIDRFMDEQT